MTVINCMKFNSEEGALISDEQSSSPSRKYDSSKKIHQIQGDGKVILLGGTGGAAYLDNYMKFIKKNIDFSELKENNEFARVISGSMMAVKNQYLDTFLKNKYGIGQKDFISGSFINEQGQQVRIDTPWAERFSNTVNGGDPEFNPYVNNMFIGILNDGENMGIYHFQPGIEGVSVPQQYHTAGSGSDVSDIVLSEFIGNKSREQRESIDPIEGVIELIYATDKAGTINQGVGGIPTIAVVKKGKIIVPNEINSKLSTEIVKGLKRGYIQPEFAKESIQALVYEDAKFRDVDKDMWNHVADGNSFSMMLRGYRN